MVPPSDGYSFVTSPYGDPDEAGVSSWSAWDALLGMTIAAKASGASSMWDGSSPTWTDSASNMEIVPSIESWCSVDDYLRAIASATPGSRTEALLRFGGKIAWATANGVGLASPAAVASALWKACETSGLVDDYEAYELERKISKYVAWADPSQNLLLRRTEQRASSVIGRYSRESFTAPQLAVFLDLGTMARAQPHPYSKRYGAMRTGFSDWTVREALRWLAAEGLIERGPMVPHVLPSGTKTKDMSTFKLTRLGNLVLNELRRPA
jgi:hypothetical protein